MDKRNVLPYAGAGAVLSAAVTGGVFYWRRQQLLRQLNQGEVDPFELLEGNRGTAEAERKQWATTLLTLKQIKAGSPSAIITALATLQINWAERRFEKATARVEDIDDTIKVIEGARKAEAGDKVAE